MRVLAMWIAALASAFVVVAGADPARARDAATPPPAPAAPDTTAAAAAVHPDTLTARIVRCAAHQATVTDAATRQLHDELLAAARELAADGDFEAAALVLEDVCPSAKPASR